MGKVNKVVSIYQVTLKGIIDGTDEVRNVHHYEYSGYVPNTAELQDLVDVLDGHYKTDMQAGFGANVTFYAYDVRRVDLAGLPANQFIPTGLSWAGTSAADALPSQIATVVTWKAQTTFPRTTRSYLFPVGEGNNTIAGRPTSAWLTIVNTWAPKIINLVTIATPDPVKVAVQYTGTPPFVVTSNPVTTAVASQTWGTQRRRRPGVGS